MSTTANEGRKSLGGVSERDPEPRAAVCAPAVPRPLPGRPRVRERTRGPQADAEACCPICPPRGCRRRPHGTGLAVLMFRLWYYAHSIFYESRAGLGRSELAVH